MCALVRAAHSYGIIYESFTMSTASALDSATDELKDFLESDAEVELFERAYFEQKHGTLARRRYPHHQLQIGDFFECHLPLSGR